MNILKRTLPIAVVISIIVMLITGSFASQALMRKLIDQGFLWGLLLTMFGFALMVIFSGFFSLFTLGFKKIKRIFFRQPRVLESDLYAFAEGPENREQTDLMKQWCTYLPISVGLSLITFSIGLTVVYYL